MKSLISTIAVSVLLLASGSQAACGQNQMEEERIYLNGGYEIVEGGLLSSTIGGGFYGRERDWPIAVDTRFEYFIAPNGFSLAQSSVHGVFEIEQAPDLLTPYVGAGVSLTSTSTSDSLASPELGEIDLPASPTNSGIDIGISLVAGGRFDLGGVDPFIQAEAIGGDQYQSVGLTAGLSIDFGWLNESLAERKERQLELRERKLSDVEHAELPTPAPISDCSDYELNPNPEGLLERNGVEVENSQASKQLQFPRHLTINIHLQTHKHPIDELHEEQDTVALNKLQDQIFQASIALAKNGATEIVVEGLPVDDWANPEQYSPYETKESTTAHRLSSFKEVNVWGFESRAIQDGVTTRIKKQHRVATEGKERILEKAKPLIEDLIKIRSKEDSLTDKLYDEGDNMDSVRTAQLLDTVKRNSKKGKLIKKKIEEIMNPLNQAVIALSLNEIAFNLRTDRALIMAIRRAAASPNHASQLIIGANHLNDFKTICRRGLLESENIKLRFYKYKYPEPE